ncbi:hypothetical protein Patl1_22112 [Pistacia atlantica]|uniref:Uncharacterized protein n=1 Tax=Pistacia atlantica TaxID=434234 RepID=A0ACC1BMK9_9ROSI|nr:hypothetical protein Patl1_22112 [Pistacia atlantica]
MERSEHGNRSDTNTDYLFQLLCFLKLHTYTRVQVSIDICGVDHPSRKRRFEVVYNLLSTRYNSRRQCGRMPPKRMERCFALLDASDPV